MAKAHAESKLIRLYHRNISPRFKLSTNQGARLGSNSLIKDETDWRMILKFAMPLYEIKYHNKTEWKEISEMELMDGLYRIYNKVTPAIKKMILGMEVETPDAVYRLKNKDRDEFSV